MTNQVDAAELLNLLESKDLNITQQIRHLIAENLSDSKESWLLNALVDSFTVSHSQRCLDILANVKEPHDKHLFDRLTEMVKGQNRLPALTILGHLIRKQPPWLHKVVRHPLLGQIIKCLKTDTDVPILMSGLLNITSLLPLVPLTITSYLPSIFEAFSRLAAFNLNKPGNVDDVYLLHLHVGIYALFHRLYAMYPCHFFTYLRSVYGKKEHEQVFQQTIQPMLEQVRLHPLLVNCSREKEVNKDRWKQMEVHDIVLECAKLSLDPGERTSELESLSLGRSIRPLSSCPRSGQPTPDLSASISQSLNDSRGRPLPLSSFGPVDPNSVWSPSSVCGLETPPPAPLITPGGTNVIATSDQSMMFSHGSHRNTPARTTPYAIVPDSPLPQHMDSTDKGHQSFFYKRLSAVSLSLAGPLPGASHDAAAAYEGGSGAGSSSVPPSPLKPHFTSEPPLGVHTMQAVRKLTFQMSEERLAKDDIQAKGSEKVSVSSGLQLAEVPPGKVLMASPKVRPKGLQRQPSLKLEAAPQQQQQQQQQQQPHGLSEERPAAPVALVAGKDSPSLHAASDQPGQSTGQRTVTAASAPEQKVSPEEGSQRCRGGALEERVPSVPNVPSVDQLHKFIDGLDVHSEDMEDTEVSELTRMSTGLQVEVDEDSGSDTPSHLPVTVALTAQSVANFMKKVKRLRFSSININKKDVNDTLPGKTSRPRSCPSLDTKDIEGQGQGQGFLGGGGPVDPFRERSDSDKWTTTSIHFNHVATIMPSPPTGLAQAASSGDIATAQATASIASQTSFYIGEQETLEECYTTTGDDDNNMAMLEAFFPYAHMFAHALPRAPLMQCYQCASRHRQADDDTQSSQPLHSGPQSVLGAEKNKPHPSLSPADLLDMHLKRQDHRVPQTDKAKLLADQVDMLHNQVLFERQKREAHAKRNRRLLGRIAKTTALEEQNVAMKDQVSLQEDEIQHLKVTMRLLQQQNMELRTTKDNQELEKDRIQKARGQELESAHSKCSELQALLQQAKADKQNLLKEVKIARAELFTKDRRLDDLQQRAAQAVLLKHQISHLNKELLLMGELQQKYQQRLVAMTTNGLPRPEMQFLLDSYKSDLASTRLKLDQRTLQYDAAKARLAELEENAKAKDAAVTGQKKTLEMTKTFYKDQLQAVETKYQTQKKISLALQGEILNLQSQLFSSQAPSKQSRPAAAARPGAGAAEAGASAGQASAAAASVSGTDSATETARQLKASSPLPSSDGETSVEDAMEAVAMDTGDH